MSIPGTKTLKSLELPELWAGYHLQLYMFYKLIAGNNGTYEGIESELSPLVSTVELLWDEIQKRPKKWMDMKEIVNEPEVNAP